MMSHHSQVDILGEMPWWVKIDSLPSLQSKNIVEYGEQHWTRKGTGTVYLY